MELEFEGSRKGMNGEKGIKGKIRGREEKEDMEPTNEG